MLIAVIISDSPQPVVSLSSAVGKTVQGFCTEPLPSSYLCSLPVLMTLLPLQLLISKAVVSKGLVLCVPVLLCIPQSAAEQTRR